MKTQKFQFELGITAKDKITRFEGIIVGRVEHLFGCNTYGIAPRVLKDGKRLETEWFDEGRLEKVNNGINPEDVKTDKNGSEYREHPTIY